MKTVLVLMTLIAVSLARPQGFLYRPNTNIGSANAGVNTGATFQNGDLALVGGLAVSGSQQIGLGEINISDNQAHSFQFASVIPGFSNFPGRG